MYSVYLYNYEGGYRVLGLFYLIYEYLYNFYEGVEVIRILSV